MELYFQDILKTSGESIPLFDKIKALSKQSAIYGAGHILSRSISFLLLPFYSHFIPPEDYGALVFLYMFIAVFQVIYVGGLDIAFLRFYVAESDDVKRRVFSNCILAIASIGAVISAFFFIFPEIVSSVLFNTDPGAADLWVRISCGILLLDTVAVVPFLRLRAENKPVQFTTFKLLNVLTNIGANILLVAVCRMGVTGAMYGNLIASALTLLLLIPIILQILKVSFNLNLLKELWRFGLPNIPALFFLYIIEFSDRKIIEVYRGLEEAGLYSAGYKMGMFMAIVSVAFRFAWQPFFLAEAKNEGAQSTFARVFTYFFAVSGFLFMVFVLFAGDFVMMRLPILNINLLEREYWAGMSVFPIILLAHFFDGLYANFTVGIYVRKKTKVVPLITGAAAAFNLGANLLLIPRFGYIAAAWTTLGSFILMAALMHLYTQSQYRIPYEWGRVLRAALVIGALLALFYLHPGGFWWRLLVLALMPPLLAVTGFFHKSEIGRFKHYIGISR